MAARQPLRRRAFVHVFPVKQHDRVGRHRLLFIDEGSRRFYLMARDVVFGKPFVSGFPERGSRAFRSLHAFRRGRALGLQLVQTDAGDALRMVGAAVRHSFVNRLEVVLQAAREGRRLQHLQPKAALLLSS